MRYLLAAAALVATGAVSGVSGAASHGTAALPAVTCKLRGIHYAGSTKQGKKLCLTLSSNGKGIREYAFGGRFKCSDGQVVPGLILVGSGSWSVGVGGQVTIGLHERPKLGRNGTFRDTFGDSTFQGRIQPTTATGTLRTDVNYGAFVTPSSCDTGLVRWSARRASS